MHYYYSAAEWKAIYIFNCLHKLEMLHFIAVWLLMNICFFSNVILNPGLIILLRFGFLGEDEDNDDENKEEAEDDNVDDADLEDGEAEDGDDEKIESDTAKKKSLVSKQKETDITLPSETDLHKLTEGMDHFGESEEEDDDDEESGDEDGGNEEDEDEQMEDDDVGAVMIFS